MKKLLFTVPFIALFALTVSCDPYYITGFESEIIIENRTAENIVISIKSENSSDLVSFWFTGLIPYGYHESTSGYSEYDFFEGFENLMIRSLASVQFFDYQTYTESHNRELIADYTYLDATIEDDRRDYSTDMEAFFNPNIEDNKFLYGTTWESASERLFVPSETRPFYIERDPERPWVAKIIITHIPTPPEESTTP